MQSNYTSAKQQHSTTTEILLWISRIFVGLLFIFSGLIKANDPMGFGYKLQEYFHVFNLNFLNEYSTWIAVVICGFEIILGALLLLGFNSKKVAWGLLLLIIFFTFLTFYSAFFEVVTSCGCFGDAIPLTPWQSFIKDLILFVFILYIFIHRNKIHPATKKSQGLITTFIVLIAFGIGIYTSMYLPFVDFLPYKEGNNIPELMKVPEGAEETVYEQTYHLKHKQTGEEKDVTDKVYMDEKIWEDDNWEIIGEPKSKLIKQGYVVPIADLHINDAEGNEVTQEIIANPYYNFIVTSTDLNALSQLDYLRLDEINATIRNLAEDYTIRAILLTASAPKDASYLNEQMDLVLETFYADAVPIKSMVRSNPGVMLLQNGVVIKKWSKNSFPDKEYLEKTYFQNIN